MREPECPSCRKSASEAQFRVNPVLEEVVSAWKAARYGLIRQLIRHSLINDPFRSTVLDLSRQEQPNAVSGHNSGNDKTPRRFQTPARNGRKRRHSKVSQSSDSDIVCVAGPSNAESSEIADSSPLQSKRARRASRRRANMEPSSDPREEELLSIQREFVYILYLIFSSLVSVQPTHW